MRVFSNDYANLTAEDEASINEAYFKTEEGKEALGTITDLVTDLAADLLYSPNNWDKDGKVVKPVDRIREVLYKHSTTLTYLMDNPTVLFSVVDNLAISSLMSEDKRAEFKEKFNKEINKTLGSIKSKIKFADNVISLDMKAGIVAAAISVGALDSIIEENDAKLTNLIQSAFTEISDKMIVEQTENLFGKAEKTKTIFSRSDEQNAKAIEGVQNIMAKKEAMVESINAEKNVQLGPKLMGQVDVIGNYYIQKRLAATSKDKTLKSQCKENVKYTDIFFKNVPLYLKEDFMKDANCKTAAETGRFRRLYENDKMIKAGEKIKTFKVYLNKILEIKRRNIKSDEEKKQQKVDLDNAFEQMKNEAGDYIRTELNTMYKPFRDITFYEQNEADYIEKSVAEHLESEYSIQIQAYDNYEKLIEYGHGQMNLTKEEMDEVNASVSKMQIQVPAKEEGQEKWTEEELLNYAKKKALDKAIADKKEEKAEGYRTALFSCYVYNTYSPIALATNSPIMKCIGGICSNSVNIDDLKSWFDDKNNYGTDFQKAVEKARSLDPLSKEYKFAEAEVIRLYCIISKNRYDVFKKLQNKEDEQAPQEARKLKQWEEDEVLEATQMKDIKSGDGVGAFYKNIFETYFSRIDNMDKRAMLASMIKTKKANKYKLDGTYDKNADRGAVLGGILKGCGPLLQKIMQALPGNATPEMKMALADVKSKLAPISDEYVDAQLAALVDRSKKKVTSIQRIKSLGAASVGQAFLCKAF